MNRIRKLAVVIVALGSASVAQATPIVVDNEVDFLSLVDDVTREGFESFPTDSNCNAGGSNPLTTVNTDNFSVTTVPQDGGTSFLCVGTTPAGFPGPTEGSNALIAGSTTGDSWLLEFLLDEDAIGVYFELTDAVERGDAYILVEGLDPILVALDGDGGLDDVLFGIVFDDPISSFSLQNTGRFDGWGVDNIILADCEPFPGGGNTGGCFPGPGPFPAPEPGTLALLTIGLFGMALSRRKKQLA